MFSSLPESAATPSDAAINSQQFVVAGEALVDVVVPAGGDPERAPGGSPLNVAVGLARLAVETVLVTELGDDELGALVREHVLASEVILPEDAVVPGLATSTATAKLDASGGATTHSLVMRSRSGTIRNIISEHQLQKLKSYASIDFGH